MASQLDYMDYASQVPTALLDLKLDALSDPDLPDEHLVKIAGSMEDWRKLYIPALDLKVRDIRWLEEHFTEEKKQR